MDDHHAIVYEGMSLADTAVPAGYQKPGIDVNHHVVERLSIGTVRAITESASRRHVAAAYQVFVIVTATIPVEAQNALLKLFEEPPATARFYLVIPQLGLLLPTLRSRVFVGESALTASAYSTVFTDFVAAPYAARLDMIAKLAKQKDATTMYALVRDAERYVQMQHPLDPVALRSVTTVSQYIRTNGASKKMLLEHLALILPESVA